MEIKLYFDLTEDEQAHWREEIGKGDWSAARLLRELLEQNRLRALTGETTELLLLTEGEALVSFLALEEQDEIAAPELTPWIGFVYTAPAYRGHRCAGRLIEEACQMAKARGDRTLYVSTGEIGLYEKYGFADTGRTMKTIYDTQDRVYRREL